MQTVLGPVKDKIFLFLLREKAATMHQIREELFPDKTTKWLSNVLYEMRRDRYIYSEVSHDEKTPTLHKLNYAELIKIINIGASLHFRRVVPIQA